MLGERERGREGGRRGRSKARRGGEGKDGVPFGKRGRRRTENKRVAHHPEREGPPAGSDLTHHTSIIHVHTVNQQLMY